MRKSNYDELSRTTHDFKIAFGALALIQTLAFSINDSFDPLKISVVAATGSVSGLLHLSNRHFNKERTLAQDAINDIDKTTD